MSNPANPSHTASTPATSPSLPSRLRPWLLVATLWTLLGVAFACQFYIANSQLGRSVALSKVLIRSLADWYVFAAISFLPIEMARRFSLEGRHWFRHLVLHLAAAGFFSIAYVCLRTVVGLWHGWPDPGMTSIRTSLPKILLTTWYFNLLVYGVIVSVAHAVAYYQKFREGHLRTVELERSLIEARLHALQMQLNPHFLFNSLGAIAELMHRDVKSADRMITRLGELLRTSLDASNVQKVSLEEELRFITRYLEIEQTRFGSRLEVSFNVDPRLLSCAVPNLILQPLIENSIKHGIEPMSGGGRIEVSACLAAQGLELTVADNGRGFPAERSLKREGIGITNSRARLRELYGGRALLELTTRSGGGVLVRVVIPEPFPESS